MARHNTKTSTRIITKETCINTIKLEHEIYSNTVNDWNQKTRNIAKINNISYIKDASLYNSIYQSNNSLYMNQAYGISSKLNFDQLDIFLEEAMQNGYIISESNSNMKLHLNNV